MLSGCGSFEIPTGDIEKLGARKILSLSRPLWLRHHIKLFLAWRRPRFRTRGAGLTRAGAQESLRQEPNQEDGEIFQVVIDAVDDGRAESVWRLAGLAGWLSAKLRVPTEFGGAGAFTMHRLRPPGRPPAHPLSLSFDRLS